MIISMLKDVGLTAMPLKGEGFAAGETRGMFDGTATHRTSP